jgi:predicted aspartyl protease
MALDTGATLVIVPMSVAHDLGYNIYQPKDMLYLTTPSGSVHVPIITLTSVEVLGAMASEVRAACIDMPVSIGFGGLLGLSFLRNFDVDLHFRSGVVRFNS